MRLREYNTLKATLDYLALLNPKGVLMVGEDGGTQQSLYYRQQSFSPTAARKAEII